jgi:hypothetical protein
MRRLTTRWLPLLFTPLIALSFARTVRADPIPYTSSGGLGAAGGSSVGNFSINATNGALFGPGSLQLASFQAPAVPDGATLTFTDMPFYINVDFYPANQTPPLPLADLSQVTIKGELNGTLTGATSSSVVASVTSVQSTGPNPLPFSLSSFNVLAPQTLAPSGYGGGTTTLIGQVTALSTPEPTPLALLGILAVGMALRSGMRRIQRRDGRAGS